jgi:hypothetical protein
LSDRCRVLIRRIAEHLGIKDAAVLEIAVRRLADQELPAEASGHDSPPTAKKQRKKDG